MGKSKLIILTFWAKCARIVVSEKGLRILSGDMVL